MIINKNSMYCPKKPTTKPVQPPFGKTPNKAVNNQMVRTRTTHPRSQRQVLVPDEIIKNNPLESIHHNKFVNELANPFDAFFGMGFIEQFFNENSLEELAKTNDINREKWTKVDPKTKAVISFESISISSKKPTIKKWK